MFRRLFTVAPSSWLLLGLVFVVALSSIIVRSMGYIGLETLLYVVQPATALLALGVTYVLARGRSDRLRRTGDKSIIVGSVLAIWFVFYFLSGLVTTYVHNAVVSSFLGVTLNIVTYGLTAAAFEYTRHRTMLLAGRRNVVWFGVVVSLVFALQQVNLSGFSGIDNLEDFIKIMTSDFVPAIASSLLLTYLAVTAGLSSQLVFRLGVVAATILPPIIPKYDWYMLGVSAVLLVIAVYITLDRNRSNEAGERRARRRHHTSISFDIMFTTLMVGLVLLMTGVFSYKPIVIMSNSMLPIFSRGSVVIVQKVQSPVDIQIGDIIQYEAENKMITHRVVDIRPADDGSGKRVFTTKGDNNRSQDPPVDQSHVVGVIRSAVPYIGYPTVWLKEVSRKV